MKLETFFEKFDQFADAPNAVAKMRELIVQSAVRGGLVPNESLIACDFTGLTYEAHLPEAEATRVGAEIARLTGRVSN